MIQHNPIEWWANKIKNNEYFSLARFGDGEILCIQGRRGGNSHGCEYTPALQKDLLECLQAPIYKGLQRITPQMFRQFRPLITGDWFDTEVFADSLAKGGMKPFFDALRKKTVIIVSSKAKQKFRGIEYYGFVETPLTNTHEVKDEIIRGCQDFANSPKVFLFACGMAAGPIINELHGKIKNSFLIDIGHILDPFLGDPSREYLKDVPEEVLMRNL